ncbi:dihydrofolate synthase / folylpolyglutamate synthase [bacterium A37T11]|nr:dihydrofolate synthase / folylpolyglutamate synthase [bacterium A37T11]
MPQIFTSYKDAIEYLYSRLPMFTRDGVSAFKKDLDNTLALCEALGNPQHQFKSVHIAGTNGKGSTSHMLAAIFQAAGYKTGLYTSPHLLDFRERIRINGQMIAETAILDFVNAQQELLEQVDPSFFEATVALTFRYFADEKVDIAIIETGLGGRLDSTNVITPELSVITNIGYDHMYLLGNTLPEIAYEKAGIIKPGVPVVVSERQTETATVFLKKAASAGSMIRFASDEWVTEVIAEHPAYKVISAKSTKTNVEDKFQLDLRGSYQLKNVRGVLSAVGVLNLLGYKLKNEHVHTGLANVQALTGLMGRWQTLANHPAIICDTGHNEDGWKEVLQNIRTTPHDRLHMVIGVMRDKDLEKMLPILPNNAAYYFSSPDMPRALPANELASAANEKGKGGLAYSSIENAILAARQQATANDLIFIGGSTFVVAEALQYLLPAL